MSVPHAAHWLLAGWPCQTPRETHRTPGGVLFCSDCSPRKGEVMTFDEVLEQALEMLRRRGRVSYRALKVQFHLDDDLLEDPQGGNRRGAPAWPGPGRHDAGVDGSVSARHPGCPHSHRLRPSQAHRRLRRPNAASSPCCSVIWWTRRAWPASSTRKSCARWCGPIKPPAPR